MVELLIDKGANVNAKNNDGNTALDIAEIKGHKGVVNLLTSSAKLKVSELGKKLSDCED